MIALIDNYDSFTFNVYQYLKEITDEEIQVFRNDKITLSELSNMQPTRIILSPGPGRPDDAGISLDVVKHFVGKIPILGICLGHQTIVQALGGKIVSAVRIVHGKVEVMNHDGRGLFRNMPGEAKFTRYHSLAAEQKSLPECLEVSSRSSDNEIMGVRHKSYVLEGVQFHPESIGSEDGKILLKNFLKYKREPLNKSGLLKKLLANQDLDEKEAEDFMDELTEGNLSEAFITAILIALNAKGIKAHEVAGCARVLQRKKQSVRIPGRTIDTCGTGGDGRGTFNISSFSALITAGMGIPVAKHGNRAVSSKSGSADFYRSLSIPVESSPDQAALMIKETGFSFLYAPLFHGAMRHAAPVRRELGIKTIMNLLGPLANPAEAECQLIGVYNSELCPVMARAARLLGVQRVMTVHSEDGLDEISSAAPTRIFFIDQDGIERDSIFDPASVGITGFTTDDLNGGSAEDNAKMAVAILKGQGNQACIEACCLNAGAASFVYGQSESIAEGYRLAKKTLKEGKVLKLVQNLRRINKDRPV
ncbi:bifunctional anthranilate synthase component II/anthranilate phosphoribosyltransferase [Oceanispirochaeta sp.]|jgi:anthranilate synthase/phosphoribosyltransferase|uniref:bifunctional anthranilate synthase component II/anthranilate phosphoribosyltransferase n=1 Tax=Oceanispirochaeta sp. TaxID=2035350 RepID=UPI002629B9A0|nr:bifunctional anthranilate synthase component II/anthranilate phosphoribosyltransferase [Oceanispirochaeta sp.]MDA3958495.1 bifunctional anthranilate synthase component II/anthranilate phosphoribosyltransferase [Oceanispirochaeta sp.]